MTNDNQHKANRDQNAATGDAQNDDTLPRFPDLPSAPDVPAPPKLTVTLPPHPDKPRPGTIEPGSMKQSALGYNAVSSFFMPIIVLSVIGYLLDLKLHHATYWCSAVGVVVGFGVGVSALLRVLNKLN